MKVIARFGLVAVAAAEGSTVMPATAQHHLGHAPPHRTNRQVVLPEHDDYVHPAAKKYLFEEYEDIPKVPIFIINLDGSVDRMDHMQEVLQQKRHLYGNACRVPAVDFRNCTSKFEYVSAPFWEQGSRGGLLASGMSHRRAWEIISLRKIKVAIVMEDDVNHYARDFDELYAQVMSAPVDWDVFRFSMMNFKMPWINADGIQRKYHDECHYMTPYRHFQKEAGVSDPKTFWGFGGAFYAISFEGAQKGLKNFNPTKDIIDSFAWASKVKCTF